VTRLDKALGCCSRFKEWAWDWRTPGDFSSGCTVPSTWDVSAVS